MRAGRRFVLIGPAVLLPCLSALALDRLCPPDLSRLAPSRIVEDRHGVMLRAFRTGDGQWRLPVDPRSVSQNYGRMLLATEDKRFFDHGGVDPLAIARAAWQLVTRGHVVSGGSTITMQVARLLEPRPRTIRSKVIEMFRAFQLEARMDKSDLLRAYLTLVPMGGNLEGVRAGSLAWFGKEPSNLSDAEAALLVALPRAPRMTRPDAHPIHAKIARRRVLSIAGAAGLVEPAGAMAADAAPLPSRRRPLPSLAPHLAERLIAEHPAAADPIRTSIEARLQGDVERLLRSTLDGLPRPIDVAAILADWHTGEVLARAGSGDYRDAARRGMIDMTRAIRSPGSTLKPFVYGMAFDGLLAHPASLVRDEATRFDDYAPHNFDGGFDGDVTIRHALQASLNLPAVLVLQRVGPVAFVDRFREAGLPLVFADPSVAPSLPVVLGGVGITLGDLVVGYAALADGGTLKPLVETYGAAPADGRDHGLMRRPAADAIVDILAGVPPPKGFAARTGRIAYKTGTSYRFRDGWALGFDGGRVIGVWMGRADGATCEPCVGAVAASLLFKLFDLLPPDPLSARTLTPVFAGAPPPALARLGPPTRARRPDAPHIAYPLAGARLLIDDTAPEVLLSVQGGARPYLWIVDGHPIDSQPFAHDATWHPTEGFATLTVVDANGQSDDIRVRVVKRDNAAMAGTR